MGSADDDDRAETEALLDEHLEAFGIRFARPAYWKFRLETDDDGGPPTYLYWDEDAGSLRITPTPVSEAFDIEAFVTSTIIAERANGLEPVAQTINGHPYVAWVQDRDSRSHFYVTGRPGLMIVCSYAYDPELLDDEVWGDAIIEGIAQAAAVIASLRFTAG